MGIGPKGLKRGLAAFLIVFGIIVASTPSLAFSTQATDKKSRQNLENLGNDFQRIAAQFGCGSFTHADFTGRHSAVLSYNPMPESSLIGPPTPWQRIVTVNYYMLSGNASTDEALLGNLRNGLFRQFYEGAQILDTASYRDDNKGPVMYIAYRTGKGDEEQYGAGILMRVSGTGAAFIQIQSRGQPIAAADGQRLQDLVKTVVALR